MFIKSQKHGSAILILFFVSVLFLTDLIFNINKPLGFLHNDAFLVNFILNSHFNNFASGNWGSIVNLPMVAGFNNPLFYTDHHLLPAIIGFPIWLITKNTIFVSNFLVIVTVYISLLSTYFFLNYLTKTTIPSVIGAIIFVLNPFIFGRFPDQFMLISLQYIPFVFLCFEKYLQNKNSKSAILFFISLILQLIGSSLNYTAFLTVILPIYAAIRIFQEKVKLKSLLNLGFLLGSIIFVLSILIVSIPYINFYQENPIARSLDESRVYSAIPSDYFFAPPNNLVYGNLKEKFEIFLPKIVRYGVYSEHNLFPGLAVLALALVGVFYYKSLNKKYLLSFFVLIIFSLWASFGPDGFLYLIIYKVDPLLSFVRTPARLAVFVFLGLSVVVAFVLCKVEKKIGKWIFLFIPLILFEYWNKPLTYLNLNNNERSFFEKISNQSPNIILHLPIGNDLPPSSKSARSIDYDAHYLLYSVLFDYKKTYNGYSGFLPSKYYDQARSLSINFPTKAKIEELKKSGVDIVVLHKKEFNDYQEYERISKTLKVFNLEIVAEEENRVAFKLK